MTMNKIIYTLTATDHMTVDIIKHFTNEQEARAEYLKTLKAYYGDNENAHDLNTIEEFEEYMSCNDDRFHDDENNSIVQLHTETVEHLEQIRIKNDIK